MSRSHARDLPNAEEVLAMMQHEQDRFTVSGHFANYFVVESWLDVLGIQTELFNLSDLEAVTTEGEKVKSFVVNRTLSVKPVPQLLAVEKYLGEEDVLKKADIAIVFGGRTLSRADKAVELYKHRWVKKLLMCGKSPTYTKFFDKPEAEVFRDRAIELGVPETDILIEPSSVNIADNVRSSLNMLDQHGLEYARLVSVISWYANRRAWCTLKKHLDSKVEVIRVNAPLPDDSKYKQGEWFSVQEGIEIVFNEFVKMKHQELTERA